MTKNIYIISGLGADERVFHRLDFSGFNAIFIRWLTPAHGESIENYATRLLEQIKTPKPIIVGLSFGGIVAVEIAKQIATEKLILIATAKVRNELPIYYRLAGRLNIHKLLPDSLLKQSNFLTNWLFGVTSTPDKALLKQILKDTDPRFLSWAIDKIINWNNHLEPPFFKHIHGTKDRILPIAFVNADFLIKGGGHLMTLNKAEEITSIIRSEL